MRRILVLACAVVFVDTLFFVALTPLLPHYADTLGLGKTGAGLLAAAYPIGALVGAIPSGIVAARVGVKPTVLVGMIVVSACIVLFGLCTQPWQLDTVRFLQGLASSFTWTGALAWLVLASPAARRGSLIGTAFACAVGGALFGPVLGGVASVAGTGWSFGVVGTASLGLAVWAATMPAPRPQEQQPLSTLFAALGDNTIRLGVWFVWLPAMLFGALGVLAPLRLSALGFSAVAIGAVFLCSAAIESANNLLVGRASDTRGPIFPITLGLAGSIVVAALLPWPDDAYVLALLVVVAGLAFGTFFTPGMTLLSQRAEHRGLDYGYAFALVNIAWAPGQSLGAAGGGALAQATSDTAVYLLLSAVCALTLLAVWRRGTSTESTTRSAHRSSASSSPTITGD
jgi:MFS family permease